MAIMGMDTLLPYGNARGSCAHGISFLCVVYMKSIGKRLRPKKGTRDSDVLDR